MLETAIIVGLVAIAAKIIIILFFPSWDDGRN